jgi:hypothetical protein
MTSTELGPWWFERQRRPESPDFVPGSPTANTTHRTWTRIGTLAGVERAVVDPRGLVTNSQAAWSLDWWVGADDRWHLPSREVAVRQQLVGESPVVETAMRVPGGDAVHRAFAVAGPDGPVVVIEIENRTAIPFAIALAIRPYHPIGDGSVTDLALDGTTVLVDGKVGLLLPRPPNRAAGSTAKGGDVVRTVLAGDAGEIFAPVHCDDGGAQAAFVYPLPHTAVLRAAMPVAPAPARRRSEAPRVRLPEPPPSVDQVAKGWDVQAARRCRIDIPDARLGSVLEAARRHLLLLAANEDVSSWPARAVPWREAAAVTVALDRFGFHDEAEQILLALPDRQALDGYVGDGDEGWAANGSALHAVGVHWRFTRDDRFAEALVGPVAKAGHWIDRHRAARRGRRSVSPPTPDDLAWSIRGLRDAADMMGGTGQPEVAEDLLRFAESLGVALRDQAPTAARDLAVAALGVLPSVDPVAARLAEQVQTHQVHDGAVFDEAGGWGFDPMATLLLGIAERRLGDPRVLERLSWLLDVATPTATWPTFVHPRSKGGSHGDGHDAAVTAWFCTFVRDLLIDDTGDGLVLCGAVPTGWLGQGWEVHDAPTALGRLGFAVRWHGDRPALLWELEPHADLGQIRITAPGLDPSWSGDQLAGEALLGPVRPGVDETGGSDDDAEASSSFN